MEEISEENTEAQLSQDELYAEKAVSHSSRHKSSDSTRKFSLLRSQRQPYSQQLSMMNIPKPSANLPYEELLDLYSYLYRNVSELFAHKASLEESLRAEMLSNEQQRTLIEVLKFNIQERLDQMELQGVTVEDINDFKKVSKSRLEEQLGQKEQQLSFLIQEKDKNYEHLQEAAETLQYAEEEVKKLEEEKERLLHYIDQQNKQHRGLENECLETKQKFIELDLTYKENSEKLQDLEKEAGHMKNKITLLESQRSSNEKEKQEYHKENENLKEMLSHYKHTSQTYKAQYDSLVINNAALSDTLKNTKEELDKTQNAYRTSKDYSRGLEESIELNSRQLKEISFDRESQVKSLESLLKNKDLEMDFVHKKSVEEQQALKLRISQLEMSLKEQEDEHSRLKERVSEYEFTLMSEEQKKKNLISSLQAVSQLQREVSMESTDELSHIFRSIMSQCDDLKEQIRRLSAENADLNNRLTRNSRVENTDFIREIISIFSRKLCRKISTRGVPPKFLNMLQHPPQTLRDLETWTEVSLECIDSLINQVLDLETRQVTVTNHFSVPNSNELISLQEENNRLNERILREKNSEQTADMFTVKAAEEKAGLLCKEKAELEDLLKKIQNALPDHKMKSILADMIRIRSDIEIADRQKIRVENELMRTEADMRMLNRNTQHQEAIQYRKKVEVLRTQLNSASSQALRAQLLRHEKELMEFRHNAFTNLR